MAQVFERCSGDREDEEDDGGGVRGTVGEPLGPARWTVVIAFGQCSQGEDCTEKEEEIREEKKQNGFLK